VNGFPTAAVEQPFIIARAGDLQSQINPLTRLDSYYDWNHVWLTTAEREPDAAFAQAVQQLPGYVDAMYAWDTSREIQREPLANALTGILFASFWVSLGLSLLDFAFYMAVTTRRRAVSFAVLRAIGWDGRHVWGLLTVEQAAFITPALVVGVLLGVVLAYLILPFLAIIGGQVLQIPVLGVLALLVVLVAAFTLLLTVAAVTLRRASVNQVMRLGE
jgi:ABC-type lipoprotein release transport system permease subunit